jgi:hypothetical protein
MRLAAASARLIKHSDQASHAADRVLILPIPPS